MTARRCSFGHANGILLMTIAVSMLCTQIRTYISSYRNVIDIRSVLRELSKDSGKVARTFRLIQRRWQSCLEDSLRLRWS